MPDFTQGKWIYDEPFGVIFSNDTCAVIANVQGAGTGSCFCLTQEGQANARLVAHAPVMYELLKDFVNPEIPADSITYQVLQEVTADCLNDIDRSSDSNTGTEHSVPHLTNKEAIAANARLVAHAPVMYELLKDFVNPEIPADSITYQVLQTATAELLNNIDRRKDSNTGTEHGASHLTDEEAVATNARLISCAPELYELLKEELIPTSDYGGTLSFAREAKIRKVLDYIDGKEGD